MKAVCSSWSNRSLSLKGHVTVFNALINSQVQYVNMNTFTPQRVLGEIKKITTKFLWADKKAKVAYNLIIQSIQDGGLGIMDLESRTLTNHLCWIQRALKNPTSTIAELIKGMMGEEDINLALAIKSPPKEFLEPVTPF